MYWIYAQVSLCTNLSRCDELQRVQAKSITLDSLLDCVGAAVDQKLTGFNAQREKSRRAISPVGDGRSIAAQTHRIL